MKKIMLLLIISLLLISCWYENDYMGAVINTDNSDEQNIELTIIKRDNKKSFNNILILTYLFERNTNLQSPKIISGEYQIIKNGTNIFDKNYITYGELDEDTAFKYFNIQAKINEKEIYIKDWENKEYYLKNIGSPFQETENNYWTHMLYKLAMNNKIATNYNSKEEYIKEFANFESEKEFNKAFQDSLKYFIE
ncbi:MAG TPA: hypothetical protein K8V77_03100 [Brachyspira hyodysenteriae]|nr:hypothetical protein [Brachyspira hyodysenteriae]